MKLESIEVVLWFWEGDWFWELNMNGDLLAKSVPMDRKDAQNIGAFIADQPEAEYREATQDEIDERARWNREWEEERRERRIAGLGIVEPKRKKDLLDVFSRSRVTPY